MLRFSYGHGDVDGVDENEEDRDDGFVICMTENVASLEDSGLEMPHITAHAHGSSAHYSHLG